MTPKSFSNDTNFPRPFNEDYELVGVLGKGGMGYVYKARDKRLERIVALKVLDSTSDEETVKRFYLEAQAMKELDHQNIVHVFDFGENKKQLFIAMTYVEGVSLSDVLRKQKQLDFDAIALIAKQIARGLLFAHSKGVIHRDIKPSNIMLTHDNRVYIMDFGISYIQQLERERLTLTGMAMGTPEYMSPEQCHGDEVTIQSDIYGLGVILYEMTCGRIPFTGTKPIEIAIKHVQEQPPAPEMFRPGIPPAFSALILKCLKKRPSDRFRDMEEFLDAFDTIFDSRRATGRQPGTKKTPLKAASILGESVGKILPVQKKLMISGIFIFPVIIILMVLLMLLHRPANTLHELPAPAVHGNFETKSVEPDEGGYEPENIFDGDLTTAWLFKAPSNPKNPILTMNFASPTLVTHMGFATGYQKSEDDAIGDRFRVYNKPKTLTLRTKEGFRQEIALEDIKGMQYPKMTPIETTEIQVFLGKAFTSDSAQAFAISELRILGMSGL